MQFRSMKKFTNGLIIISVIMVLPACATSWPDPYKKPEPVVVSPPKPYPEVRPEPEPSVVETMPLPDEQVIIGTQPDVNAPAPPPVMEAEPELEAVVALRGQASDSMQAGEPELAAATIERALRIQPRNPVLWLDLAAIRFVEEQFDQCENTAKRALSYAGNKSDVSYDAWMLIASSRYARNDRDGAERAEAEAARYQ